MLIPMPLSALASGLQDDSERTAAMAMDIIPANGRKLRMIDWCCIVVSIEVFFFLISTLLLEQRLDGQQESETGLDMSAVVPEVVLDISR